MSAVIYIKNMNYKAVALVCFVVYCVFLITVTSNLCKSVNSSIYTYRMFKSCVFDMCDKNYG